VKIGPLFFAAAFAVVPLAKAPAQGQSPTTGATDSKAADTKPANSAALNRNNSGGTGSTVVPGSNSSISGDNAGTADAKTGGRDTGSSGRGGK
jgi:hypothetical protein